MTNPAKEPAAPLRPGIFTGAAATGAAGPVLTHSRQIIASATARMTIPALRRT